MPKATACSAWMPAARRGSPLPRRPASRHRRARPAAPPRPRRYRRRTGRARSRCRGRARRAARRPRRVRRIHDARDSDRCHARPRAASSACSADEAGDPEPLDHARARASRGSRKTTARRAPTPATATTISPTRKQAADVREPGRDRCEGRERDAVEQAEREERERRPRRCWRGERRQRRTTATRSTSSQRPGSAIPPTDAAPPAAASVSIAGRSPVTKSRCQPQAFAASAASVITTASPTSHGFARCERPALRGEVARDHQRARDRQRPRRAG